MVRCRHLKWLYQCMLTMQVGAVRGAGYEKGRQLSLFGTYRGRQRQAADAGHGNVSDHHVYIVNGLKQAIGGLGTVGLQNSATEFFQVGGNGFLNVLMVIN